MNTHLVNLLLLGLLLELLDVRAERLRARREPSKRRHALRRDHREHRLADCVFRGSYFTHRGSRTGEKAQRSARREDEQQSVNRPKTTKTPRGKNQKYAQVFFASNARCICGSRSVGRPLGLSGSGTKYGFSAASHGCRSASAAVGRDVGSIVRHSRTKSRAVSETFAQYSSMEGGGGEEG